MQNEDMHDVSASRKRAVIKDHKPICKDLVSQFLHSAQHAATSRVHRHLHTSRALMVSKQMCKTAQVAVLMHNWFKLRLAMDQLRYSEKQHKEMNARFENRMYKQLLLNFRVVLQDGSILTRLQPLPSEYFPVNQS